MHSANLKSVQKINPQLLSDQIVTQNASRELFPETAIK